MLAGKYVRLVQTADSIAVVRGVLEAEARGFDAAVIGNIFDPGLYEARQLLQIPVVGLAEAGLLLGRVLAGRPAVLCTNPLAIPRVRENAARFQLLSDEYPFRYRVLRRLSLEYPDGRSTPVRTDTLEIRSDERHRYRPGRVVGWGTGRLSRTRVVHLPELADLADSTFHATHCFAYLGVDSLAERGYLRVDFNAATALRDPDVEGTAWLDPATYQLRQVAVRLTRPSRVDRTIEALSATVGFREVRPSLIVVERVTAITTWTPSRVANRAVGQTEEQRLVRVDFRREPGTGP